MEPRRHQVLVAQIHASLAPLKYLYWQFGSLKLAIRVCQPTLLEV